VNSVATACTNTLVILSSCYNLFLEIQNVVCKSLALCLHSVVLEPPCTDPRIRSQIPPTGLLATKTVTAGLLSKLLRRVTRIRSPSLLRHYRIGLHCWDLLPCAIIYRER
jgi:hypothetical protein